MVVVGRTMDRLLPGEENREVVSDAGIHSNEQWLEGKHATLEMSDGIFPLRQVYLLVTSNFEKIWDTFT